MSNESWSENINALYPRPKGRGSTAIFDSNTNHLFLKMLVFD